MQFVNVLVGENGPIARDYMKHYRSSILHVLDHTYHGSREFQTGWPTYVLVDASGTIAHFSVGLEKNPELLAKTLDRVLNEEVRRAAGGSPSVVCEDGICTVVAAGGELPLRQQAPELTQAPDGSLWLVYVSDAEGDANVYLRRVNDESWSRDLAVTRSIADDYAPDLVVGADGRVWVTWCSNRSGKYDIYVRALDGTHWSKEQRVTSSEDDAMAPALAVDGGGRLWVTYYRWNRDQGTSRDRDVFARHLGPQGWSKEIQVSPPEPLVEDHSDPDIVADPLEEDRVWIAWSYDYHPSLFEKPEDADQPTIYARNVGLEGPVSERLVLVGTPGESRHAIDLWPSLAVDPDGLVWCAYDMATPQDGTRGALVTHLEEEGCPLPERVIGSRGAFCSPRLSIDEAGIRMLVWAEEVEGRWSIHGSQDEGDGWGEPRLLLKSTGDLREPVLVTDGEGRSWLACEEQLEAEVRIRVAEVHFSD